jgi:hypothetical protein
MSFPDTTPSLDPGPGDPYHQSYETTAWATEKETVDRLARSRAIELNVKCQREPRQMQTKYRLRIT